ncbi:MAG: hypothetical protein IPL43_00685 [Micropruina sp.]|nr:hypothetical protein [Micropruina sp.]
MTVPETADQAAAMASPPTGEIATLPPAPIEPPRLSRLNPRTGAPIRPWTIWLSAGLLFAAPVVVTVALGFIWWDMASPWQPTTGEEFTKTDRFASSAWLAGAVEAPMGSWVRVALAIAVTAVVVAISAVASAVGYYAFAGYRWTRIGGLVALAVSLLALLLTPLAWAAIGCVALAAGGLWLPTTRRYFDAWFLLRHPAVTFSPPLERVQYGPVPRFG